MTSKSGTIYSIKCIPENKVYVGYTSHSLWKCLGEHMRLAHNNKSRHPRLSEDIRKYGERAFTIYALEENVSKDKQHECVECWIKDLKASDSKFGYNERGGRISASTRAEYLKQYNAEYYRAHKENVEEKSARNAEYYHSHKDKILIQHANRRDARREYDNRYYEAHREEILARAKARYAAKKAAKNNK